MAYTPELSLEASCTLRRLAWSWKMPMTKAIEKVFFDIAHVYDRERICALCRDITRCKECAFQTKRIKEMKTIICDLCKENEGLTFPVQINCKVGPIGKENHFDYADICLECLIRVLKDFLREEPLDTGRRFLAVIRKAKEKEKLALIS